MNYQTTDENPWMGKSFYRLRIVDQDASFKFSNEDMVYFGTPAEGSDVFIVYPNPNRGIFTITASEFAGAAELKVYNALGQVVSERTLLPSQQLDMNLSHLGSGVYMLEFTRDQHVSAVRMIIQK